MLVVSDRASALPRFRALLDQLFRICNPKVNIFWILNPKERRDPKELMLTIKTPLLYLLLRFLIIFVSVEQGI
jgi:hypothetical protein